jgi:hypothetical protein
MLFLSNLFMFGEFGHFGQVFSASIGGFPHQRGV